MNEKEFEEFEEELKEDVMAARSIIRGFINTQIDFSTESGLASAYENFRAVASQALAAASSVEALIWINKIKKKATA